MNKLEKIALDKIQASAELISETVEKLSSSYYPEKQQVQKLAANIKETIEAIKNP